MKRSPLKRSRPLGTLSLATVLLMVSMPALASTKLTINNLSPSSAAAGSAGFTLGVTGSGFNGKCVVLWNGQALATTIMSGSSATAAVPAADVMSAGSDSITVQNTRTGTSSNSVTFTVTAATAVASVSVSVSPNAVSLAVGASQQFTANVTGTTNTGVTWTTSGGAINASGLYVAPTTAGSYTVAATSAADPTKSAMATVTVTAPIAVSISPSAVSVAPGGSQQFTASVTGTSNTGVTWTTSGGAINASGLYVAPTTAGTYTVKATSMADSTKSASATVSVIAPASTLVSVSISPTSASLLTGGTQQFTASVSGTTNTGVTWTASGGSVTTAGLYTAPGTAGSYTVTATSTADATKSASASVAVSVAVSAPVQHSVQLNWMASASSGVVGYDIYRSTVSGSGYTLLNSAPDAALSYTDSSVQAGQTYYYVVTAVTSGGMQSSDSTQVTAMIP